MKVTPKHSSVYKYVPQKKNILTLDTEDNSKGKVLLYDFFDGENHYTTRLYSDVENFLEMYKDKYTEIWCANLNYDIGNLFKFKNSWHLIIKCAGSRFITVKSLIYKKIIFKDIFNVMPGQSVKKLGNLINLPKLEVNGEFDNEYYCQRDSEIVFWALQHYRQELLKIDVELKTTAASTAFQALSNKVPVLKNAKLSTYHNDYFREGYYGGRTEVFNTAKITTEVNGYDIISSYPYAMTKITIPDTLYISDKFLIEKHGMSDVTITAPDLHIPYLPFRDEKLLFPIGTWRAKYTHFELREAKKLGYIINEVHSSLTFEKEEVMNLNDFIVETFKSRNRYKKSKNEVMTYVLKILLNSSYGKFGQGKEFTELLPFDERQEVIGSEVFGNNQIIRKTIDEKYPPYTNFYIAALITAQARHNIYEYIKIRPEDAVYCDTDSLYIKGELPKKVLGNSLGDLEHQHTLKECHFVAPKVYYVKTTDNKVYYKCRGVWGDLAQEYFTKGHVNKMQPLKYIETCRKNLYKAKKKEHLLDFNIWVDKLKSKKSDYDKRVILKNGITQPIRLNV